MNQIEKARAFSALHIKGNPLVLYNIWDAGGARALAKAGAPAVATGSMSVAASQGYKDGQDLPLDQVLIIAERISTAVDVPVSIDFEGAYAVDPDGVAANVTRLIGTGAIGINFEDQVVGAKGLYPIEVQAERIGAARAAAEAAGVPVHINARTDLFLKAPKGSDPSEFEAESLERAAAYTQAGADSYFVPGLTDGDQIARLCQSASLPVNVMAMGDQLGKVSGVAAMGVARLSFGPAPYFAAMQALAQRYQDLS